MRIVFMGTPDFAVPSFLALHDAGYEIVGVFTQPDRPKGRGNKLTPSPVKTEAVRLGIPVYQPAKIRLESVEDLRALKPDVCVTAAFGQLLSQELLDIPHLGTVNVHASLLPKHRGSAPIAWSLIMGDRVTGVTTMLTDKGMDTGAMLLKQEVPIEPEDTCGSLTEKLSVIGAELLIRTLRMMEDGTLVPEPQNEAEATYEKKLTKEMGILDWSRPAKELHDLVRGLSPWPGTVMHLDGQPIKVLRTEAIDGCGKAGTILAADPKNGLVIAAGEGALRILMLQAPGKKAMNGSDWLRGHSVTAKQVDKGEQV